MTPHDTMTHDDSHNLFFFYRNFLGDDSGLENQFATCHWTLGRSDIAQELIGVDVSCMKPRDFCSLHHEDHEGYEKWSYLTNDRIGLLIWIHIYLTYDFGIFSLPGIERDSSPLAWRMLAFSFLYLSFWYEGHKCPDDMTNCFWIMDKQNAWRRASTDS